MTISGYRGGGAPRNQLFKGFTLAEVLVTLGIIGIIAALTIPRLIDGYRKVVITNQLKKNYSVLQNVIMKGQADYGPFGEWPCFYAWHGGKLNTNAPLLREILTKYIQSLKSDAKSSTAQQIYNMCNADSTYVTMTGAILRGPTVDPAWQKELTMYLNDGSCWYFKSVTGSAPIVLEQLRQNNGNNAVFQILIDVNGSKKAPNKLGIDLFAFDIYYNGRIASYDGYDPQNCKAKSSKLGSGYACAQRLVQDNFEVKEDYPWNWRR